MVPVVHRLSDPHQQLDLGIRAAGSDTFAQMKWSRARFTVKIGSSFDVSQSAMFTFNVASFSPSMHDVDESSLKIPISLSVDVYDLILFWTLLRSLQ